MQSNRREYSDHGIHTRNIPLLHGRIWYFNNRVFVNPARPTSTGYQLAKDSNNYTKIPERNHQNFQTEMKWTQLCTLVYRNSIQVNWRFFPIFETGGRGLSCRSWKKYSRRIYHTISRILCFEQNWSEFNRFGGVGWSWIELIGLLKVYGCMDEKTYPWPASSPLVS